MAPGTWRAANAPSSVARTHHEACTQIFRRSPGFAILASGSLALGLSLTAILASVANAILFRPLPVDHPWEVVRLFTASAAQPLGLSSYPDFADLNRASSTTAMVAQTQVLIAVNTCLGSFRNCPPAQIRLGLAVTPDYFERLHVPAKLGRIFHQDDSHEPVVILSHSFWAAQLTADPEVIGRTIHLSGAPFTVIGIAPEKFGLDRFVHEDFYVPIQVYDAGLLPSTGNPSQDRGRRYLSIYARLRRGATIQQARAEIATIGTRLESENSSTNHGRRMVVLSEFEARAESDRTMPALARLLIAVAILILTIACSNVAGLLLLRAETLAREIAIKVALGATRTRLLLENLATAATLGTAGVACAIPLAWAGMLALDRIATLPSDLPFRIVPTIDSPVLLLTVAAAGAISLLCGVALNSRAGGRDVLVTIEIALASALLACGASLAAAISSASKIDPGYRADHVLTLALDPAQIRYTEVQARAFYDQVLHHMPGAALAQSAPLGFTGAQRQIEIAREPERSAIWMNIVTPDYFHLLRIPILTGRAFDSRDTAASTPVAIVNEELAKRCGVGARFKMNGRFVEVVGVARNAKYFSIGEPPRPYFYLPFSQNYASRMTLLVAGQAHAVVDEIRAIDPAQPVSEIRPASDYLTQGALFQARVALKVIAAVGFCGLALALAGVYGVVSRWVAMRQREIGIRMALGAKPAVVVFMILRRAAWLASIGTAAGVAAASQSAQFLTGLAPVAPFSIGCLFASALVFACGMIAALRPAYRAARVDPSVCLRQ